MPESMIGKLFGKLTVTTKAKKLYRGLPLWECQCFCGKKLVISQKQLESKKARKSCGCVSRKKRVLGATSNQLKIVGFENEETYRCVCSCGNYTTVSRQNFTKVKSCGCAKRKINILITSFKQLEVIVTELGLSTLEKEFLISTELKKNSIADTARKFNKKDSQICCTRRKVAKWLESNQLEYAEQPDKQQPDKHDNPSDVQKPSILNGAVKIFNKDAVLIDVSPYWLYNAKKEQLIFKNQDFKNQDNLTIDLSSYKSETLCYDLVTLAGEGRLPLDVFNELAKLVQMYLKK